MSVNSCLAVNSEILFLNGKDAITFPGGFHFQKRHNNYVTQQKSNSFLFFASNSICKLDPAQEIFTETEWHTNSLPLDACESVICSLKIFSKILILVFSSVVFCHILDQTTYYEAK
jgi:hypothetical protein